MLRLAERYSSKPLEELPLLFQRILQNIIRDHYRRHKVRSLWTTLLSSLRGKDDEEDRDPLETLEVKEGANRLGGRGTVGTQQTLGMIEQGLAVCSSGGISLALEELVERHVMGCSEVGRPTAPGDCTGGFPKVEGNFLMNEQDRKTIAQRLDGGMMTSSSVIYRLRAAL